MQFDPDLIPLLDNIPPLDASDPSAARSRSVSLGESTRPPEAYSGVERIDRTIPIDDGNSEIPVRMYVPEAGGAGRPCLLFFHGGGWISGTIEGQDWRCVQLAAELSAVVVSVGYRLAPEYPFPAATEDCYAALQWVCRERSQLGIDPACIGLVGASAGGGLAAAVALMTRDRGGPSVALQCLLYPVLDDTMDTESNRRFTNSPLWNSTHSVWAWRYYLPPEDFATGSTPTSPYAAPTRANDLSGLPTAYIMTSEVDPVRDEGLEYGLRLLRAGVPCELHNWSYTFHAFEFVGQSTEIGQRAIADMLFWLRRTIRLTTTRESARTVPTT